MFNVFFVFSPARFRVGTDDWSQIIPRYNFLARQDYGPFTYVDTGDVALPSWSGLDDCTRISHVSLIFSRAGGGGGMSRFVNRAWPFVGQRRTAVRHVSVHRTTPRIGRPERRPWSALTKCTGTEEAGEIRYGLVDSESTVACTLVCT